ncbi:hypothetical protein FA95DRAFT_1572073, partial [Auriscalpium vulgare]
SDWIKVKDLNKNKPSLGDAATSTKGYPFIEYADGSQLKLDDVELLRRNLRHVFQELVRRNIAPDKWSQASLEAQSILKSTMYDAAPYLKLCHGEWKLEHLATQQYSQFARQRREQAKVEPKAEQDVAASTLRPQQASSKRDRKRSAPADDVVDADTLRKKKTRAAANTDAEHIEVAIDSTEALSIRASPSSAPGATSSLDAPHVTTTESTGSPSRCLSVPAKPFPAGAISGTETTSDSGPTSSVDDNTSRPCSPIAVPSDADIVSTTKAPRVSANPAAKKGIKIVSPITGLFPDKDTNSIVRFMPAKPLKKTAQGNAPSTASSATVAKSTPAKATPALGDKIIKPGVSSTIRNLYMKRCKLVNSKMTNDEFQKAFSAIDEATRSELEEESRASKNEKKKT